VKGSFSSSRSIRLNPSPAPMLSQPDRGLSAEGVEAAGAPGLGGRRLTGGSAFQAWKAFFSSSSLSAEDGAADAERPVRRSPAEPPRQAGLSGGRCSS